MINLLLAIIVCCFSISAEPESFGIDYLGGARYPDVVVENHPEGFACGFLWEVDGFGSAKKAVNQLLKSGKCTKIRIHLSWKDSHNFTESDIPEAERKTQEVMATIGKFPRVQFYISPWLEHKANLQLIQKLKRTVKKYFTPQVKYVNSFISGGAYLPNEINEIHHSFNVPRGDYIYSDDGVTALDSDVSKINITHKNALIRYLWDSSLNLKYATDEIIRREDRKLIPPAKLIQSLALMAQDKGDTSLPAKELYKAYGEAEPENGDHSKPISRSWKPLFILTEKASEVVLKVKGQIVATFSYSKPYLEPNRYIYRSNEWGIDIAERVRKITGENLANVWVNDKRIGKINLLFRENFYRN